MSTVRTSSSQPQLRAADADRDAALAELSDHFQAGRLTPQEFDERSSRALTSRTIGDLDGLLADLPPASVPAPASVPGSGAAGLTGARLTRPVAVLVVLAGLATLAGVVLTGSHHHGWAAWWIIPVALVVARRIAGRPRLGGPRARRRGWHEDYWHEGSENRG